MPTEAKRQMTEGFIMALIETRMDALRVDDVLRSARSNTDFETVYGLRNCRVHLLGGPRAVKRPFRWLDSFRICLSKPHPIRGKPKGGSHVIVHLL